ncbi:MAG: hypothetical protein AUH33_05495, partial [Chloroflexi bacterium 13_1_40CM_68_21]
RHATSLRRQRPGAPVDRLSWHARCEVVIVRFAQLLALLALIVMVCPAAAPAKARPIVVVAANQSFNWSGYVQGRLEKNTTFHSIAVSWSVPTARPHRAGEAEYSSSWIGIGGGCLDTSCKLTDATLIQAGIGHDVDASGRADYYAWWEAIPVPLVRTGLRVHPGDRVHVTFSLTLPYASTHGSAEWVIETPVVISETTGAVTVGPMPKLSVVHFNHATANGRPAGFVPAERIELVDFDLTLIATPSVPDRQADGFNDCVYRTSCPAPSKR